MKRSLFGSYSSRIKMAYGGFFLFCVILIIIYLVNNHDPSSIQPALLQLGRVMGGAFTFTFSIGTYLAKQSEESQPQNMPLFNDLLLMYIAFFAFVTISPFILFSAYYNNDLFFILSIGCFILSFFCLSFIPFAYEMIRTRYYPRNVFSFLRNTSIRNIEETSNYTPAWQNIIEITKICSKAYKYDVDLFSSGIGHLIAILHRGVELFEEREEISLNNIEIGLNEWIRKLQVRMIWLGQEVIEYPLAFERVIVQVIFLLHIPETVFSICNFLCEKAFEKEQTESLEKGLFYFIPWCERNDFLGRLQPLLNKINENTNG